MSKHMTKKAAAQSTQGTLQELSVDALSSVVGGIIFGNGALSATVINNPLYQGAEAAGENPLFGS
jgi:hypothetical protein